MNPIHSPNNLLQQKQQEFEELNQQFIAYEQETRAIINDLQHQNRNLRLKKQQLQQQLDNLRQKKKDQIAALQKDNQLLKKQNHLLKNQCDTLRSDIVCIQNSNDRLQAELRATNSLLQQYKQKVQKAMEELACLGVQLQECRDRNQQQTARLQAQIRQTQEELNIIKLKHQKHNQESGLRLSNLSCSSISDRRWLRKDKEFMSTDSNLQVKKQKLSVNQQECIGFEKTISLMNSLLMELDKKALKIRYASDH